MKKLVFSLVVLATLCLSSCGGKTASTEVASDSTVIDSVQVDSTVVDSAVVIVDLVQ